MLWEHTPAATVPYLGLGAEISLVGYVLKTPPVGILDVPKNETYEGPGILVQQTVQAVAVSSFCLVEAVSLENDGKGITKGIDCFPMRMPQRLLAPSISDICTTHFSDFHEAIYIPR